MDVPVYIWIILLFFVAIPIGQAIARLIESKAEIRSVPDAADAAERLGELERLVGTLTEQVGALQDNQEFLTRLLEGRSSSERAAQIEEEKR